jgi:hypothetical protein
MAFWGNDLGDKGIRDPKRKFRFKVTITGFAENGTTKDSLVWYAKTVTKPTINIGADTAHKYLGHTFKFPGSVTWDDIELTLVDPGGDDDDAAEKLLAIIQGSGYKFPKETTSLETISKAKSTTSLGSVVISQLDATGEYAVERWTLHNPFINKVSFNDLSYEDDGLSEINLGITFDWAEFSKGGPGVDDSKFFE